MCVCLPVPRLSQAQHTERELSCVLLGRARPLPSVALCSLSSLSQANLSSKEPCRLTGLDEMGGGWTALAQAVSLVP